MLFAENAGWPLPILVGMTSLLLFPGRAGIRGWRRVLGGYTVVGVLVLASRATSAWYLATRARIRIEDVGGAVIGVPHPGGLVFALLRRGPGVCWPWSRSGWPGSSG